MALRTIVKDGDPILKRSAAPLPNLMTALPPCWMICRIPWWMLTVLALLAPRLA